MLVHRRATPSIKFVSFSNLQFKFTVYLGVGVFSTVVLIVDTVNKETNITNRTEIC